MASGETNLEDSIKDLRNIFGGSDKTINEFPNVWLKSIRDKLYTMFRCPLKDEYRREAFKWVASLSMSIGDLSWISPESNWTPNEARIFSLISRLSMNEITILLPYIQWHLTNDKADQEDDKVMARPADKFEYDAFGDHLVILEGTVVSLVKNQEEDEEFGGKNALADCFDSSELQNLLSRLKETISDICDYLENCHRYWDRLLDQSDSDKFSAFEGSLRIMCLWLSEDPSSFATQCQGFLVDLILKNLLLADRINDRDIYMTALHSICTQNEQILETLRKNPFHREGLQKYLDQIQRDQDDSETDNRRTDKKFKLRCGLVRDLMSLMRQQ